MDIYYNDPYVKIIQGDCRGVLVELPAEGVQCVVTSPPYWGLRKYSGEQDLIWGDWVGSYGLEPTPEMYIDHTIEILRAIRRVLRKDGVCFWNIGDNYFTAQRGDGGWQRGSSIGVGTALSQAAIDARSSVPRMKLSSESLKHKDLCLIPFDVANAAQRDGWWVRSVIIWSKPNPMPESAADRPTKSHEYILMLTKSADYYWDADAVREVTPEYTYRFRNAPYYVDQGFAPDDSHRGDVGEPHTLSGRNIRSVWTFPTEASGLEMCLKCKTIYESAVYQRLPSKVIGKGQAGRMGRGGNDPDLGNRNFMPIEEAIEVRDQERKIKVCRCGASDWLSHFAVFPEKLPELCIKAATPEVGSCALCGAPYERVTRVVGKQVTDAMRIAGCKEDGSYEGQDLTDYGEAKAQSPSDTKRRILGSMSQVKEYDWKPTCKCNAGTVPSVALDPFAGSGRVGKVAKDLGRQAILIDTSEDYCRLAKRRIEVVPLPMIFPVEETYPEAPEWF